MRKTFPIIGIAIIVVIVIAVMNQNSNAASASTYEEKVMTVKEIEESEPTRFLSADGNYNQNFFGTKLKIHGVITNKATVVTYKDAVVKITYYSKTKTELGSKDYTIYEFFPPNSTKPFELKVENYDEVASIGWQVIQATPN